MTNLSAFYNRLLKNLSRLKSYKIQHKIECYRLFEKDIPEYPYIVDVYNEKVVVYEQGKRLEESEQNSQLVLKHQSEILDSLIKLGFKEENIFFKQRKVKVEKSQYEKFSTEGDFFVVSEKPARLWVNLTDYLDTGLFLDHRPIRQIIYKESKGKSFLNLFAYTGSVSVFAALGGAVTTTVDMSNTYLNWTCENFELNNIAMNYHQFIREDCLKFVKSHTDKYDLIFLDPPTFSNSKKMEGTFDVGRDQVELIKDTMKLLTKDGTLYFSTNQRSFKLDPEISELFKVSDISKLTIPPDFRNEKIHQCYKISVK